MKIKKFFLPIFMLFFIILLSVLFVDVKASIENDLTYSNSQNTRIEIFSMRTENTKYYQISDNIYRACVYAYPIHYFENNEWKEYPLIDNLIFPSTYESNTGASQVIYDTYISITNQNTNYGHQNTVNTYRLSNIGLFRFNMPYIPDNGAIVSAYLNLKYYYPTSNSSNIIWVSTIDSTWSEYTSTYANTYSCIGNTFLKTNIQFDSTITASNLGLMSLDISAQAVKWYEGNANNGVAIQSITGNEICFCSFESGYNTQPIFTVDYICIENTYSNFLANNCMFGSIFDDIGDSLNYYSNVNDFINDIIELYDILENDYGPENRIITAWRYSLLLGSIIYNFDGDATEWNLVCGNLYSSGLENILQSYGYMVEQINDIKKLFQSQHNNYENSIDFAHMMMSMSARIALYIRDNNLYTNNILVTNETISLLAGWYGDAVLDGSSLNEEDYLADLDAENIYRLLINTNKTLIKIIPYYYDYKLINRNRADYFCDYFSYDTVKQMIINRLRISSDGSDDETLERLKYDAVGAYNLIYNLFYLNNELVDYTC